MPTAWRRPECCRILPVSRQYSIATKWGRVCTEDIDTLPVVWICYWVRTLSSLVRHGKHARQAQPSGDTLAQLVVNLIPELQRTFLNRAFDLLAHMADNIAD